MSIIVYPPGYQYSWKDVPKIGTFVEEMIPSDGIVLLYGPAGTGKTTFVCNMLNEVAANQQFLGRMTNPCGGMLLSFDTPKNVLMRRWLDSKPQFKPGFCFYPHEPVDCLHPDFKNTDIYKRAKAMAKEHKVGIVAVDSLRDCFNGELVDDEMPKRVYTAFREWFDGATIVFIHHTRKQQFVNGRLVEGNPDDEATGSKFWVNKAQVALYLRKQNALNLRLDMGKSQCFGAWNEPIIINMDGMAMDLFDEQQAQQHRQLFNATVTTLSAADPQWSTLREDQKIEKIAQTLGKSKATIWRWKKESRN